MTASTAGPAANRPGFVLFVISNDRVWPCSSAGPALMSVLALGVFPLGIGHTLYNAALRRTHPTRVNIIATQEVTGGILLSWWLLGEVPSVNALLGAAIMLVGVIQVVI